MSRELIAQVLSPAFDLARALTSTSLEEVSAAIAEIEATQPLSRVEPKLDGVWANRVLDALRPLGAKISIGAKPEDVRAWTTAVVAALSDLPPRIAVGALRKALHRPMRFLNEVEFVVREYAEEAIEAQANALWRLKRMKREIERAANPLPQIEQKPKVWTQAEIDEANDMFRSLRLRTRWKLVGTDCENDEEAMSAEQARKEKTRADSMRDIDAGEIEA